MTWNLLSLIFLQHQNSKNKQLIIFTGVEHFQ